MGASSSTRALVAAADGSPQITREPSWLNFREAASYGLQRQRRRRRTLVALGLASLACAAPSGALPALLPALTLGSRGAVRFDELCLLGVAYHVGSAVAAAKRKASKRARRPSPGAIARLLGGCALAAAALAAAPLGAGDRGARCGAFLASRLVAGYCGRRGSDALLELLGDCLAALDHPPESAVELPPADRRAASLRRSFALRSAPVVGGGLGFCAALAVAAPATYATSTGADGCAGVEDAAAFAWRATLGGCGGVLAIAAVALPAVVRGDAFARSPARRDEPTRRRESGSLEEEDVGADVDDTADAPADAPAEKERPAPFEARVRRAVVALDAGLWVAHFLGALVLKVALRRSPERAEEMTIFAYVACAPLGAAVGAAALSYRSSRRRRCGGGVARRATRGRLFRLDRHAGASPQRDAYGATPVRTSAEVRRSLAKRRRACWVALAWVVAAFALAAAASGISADVPQTPAGVSRRERSARLGLGSVAAAVAALPALAVLASPARSPALATPRAALARALPLAVAAAAFPDGGDGSFGASCLGVAARARTRAAARAAARLGWQAAVAVAALCLVAALCARVAPGPALVVVHPGLPGTTRPTTKPRYESFPLLKADP